MWAMESPANLLEPRNSMSSVNSVGNNSPVQKIINNPIQKQLPASAQPASGQSGADKVELSGVSHLLTSLKANDIRVDKVASVKAQIEAGTYEDDHKLDVAADRLLDDLTD
jgi:anti-sigma28 factor (negative regulator of flagellin synthesis)